MASEESQDSPVDSQSQDVAQAVIGMMHLQKSNQSKFVLISLNDINTTNIGRIFRLRRGKYAGRAVKVLGATKCKYQCEVDDVELQVEYYPSNLVSLTAQEEMELQRCWKLKPTFQKPSLKQLFQKRLSDLPLQKLIHKSFHTRTPFCKASPISERPCMPLSYHAPNIQYAIEQYVPLNVKRVSFSLTEGLPLQVHNALKNNMIVDSPR